MVKKGKSVVEAWLGPGRRDAEIKDFRPEHDALHVDLQSKNKFEHWYFDARFKNGYTCIVFFYADDIESGKPQVNIGIYTPGGRKDEELKNFKLDQIRLSTKEADLIFGKNNYLLPFYLFS